jgi:hypothetical protein
MRLAAELTLIAAAHQQRFALLLGVCVAPTPGVDANEGARHLDDRCSEVQVLSTTIFQSPSIGVKPCSRGERL